MALNRKLLTTGLATLGLLVTTIAASAAPAVATGNVNVRSGPGTSYGVVDTLRRGEQVDVQHCRGSWCFVEKRGPNGWVSANYLSSGDRGWNRPPPPPPVWTPPRPPRPPHWNPRPRPQPPHWNSNPRPVYPVRPGNPGASFCFNGPNGYFCMNS
ncbi:SH3 domain-containing protein [Devosia sp. YIM 151766]|uniref:SH3 domain-containing protein n=1 Tax=Devosia sp. YIM 151766 TaxID=3017325 RepID=UPI00255C9FC4|nr:SH3 domain-containing protein [Devosia sp. YIM 151766]WIY51850.1 SH3 domain-containing protein [Devosia sp. YIM 151766]